MSVYSHGTEEQLEQYALGKLPASQTVELEEHLLVCSDCLEQVQANEQWTMAVREALEVNPIMERRPKWFEMRWLQVGFATAAILVIGVTVGRRSGPAVDSVVKVELAAVRGETVAVVKRAQEFDLTLADAPTDSGTTAFRVQVVDSGGTSEWDGAAPRTGNGVEVQVKKPLASGSYFVRLYAPGGQMLHEYGLRVF